MNPVSLLRRYREQLAAASPNKLTRPEDIYITGITETVTETTRTVLRPATEEEAAQVEIARRIAKLGLK